MNPRFSFACLSDADLTIEMKRLLGSERSSTARLVACISEFDFRRIYLGLGFSSMFTYCRDHLHLGDGAAYRRIEAARASRRFPVALELIASGSVTLTNLVLIAPLLTYANHAALLAEITHRKKSEVEVIIARLKPRPDAPTMVRRMPAPKPVPATPSANRTADAKDCDPPPPLRAPARPVVAPLSPERFKLQITMSQETHDRLRQVQRLMRHSIPSGDVGVIIDRALTCLLQDLLRRKTGARKSDFRREDDPRRPERGGHAGLLH